MLVLLLLLCLLRNFTELPHHLAHLECVDCNLTGALPRMPASLRRLDLSDNNLTGDIELINLSRMQVGVREELVGWRKGLGGVCAKGGYGTDRVAAGWCCLFVCVFRCLTGRLM